jgi:GNAT superfamily N-acetyltransferase
LNDALNQTATRALWFYGGDEVARQAVTDLQFALEPRGAVLVRRMDPAVQKMDLALRAPGPRDRMTLSEVHAEHAAGFTAPETMFAQLGSDVVGVAMSEALDAEWTEIRVVVYPAYRGRGIGSAIFSAFADRLEGAGRLVCAALDSPTARGRTALEHAGFRVADYYFSGRRPAR